MPKKLTKATSFKSSLGRLIKSVQECAAGASAPVAVLFPVNPVPASRPRVTRWGVYYGKTYKKWMAEVERVVGLSSPSDFSMTTRPLLVVNENVVEKPRTSEREYPRGDVDNYAKAALDAITKHQLAWQDDDQVVALLAIKRFAEPGELPHTKTRIIQL